MVKKIVRVGTGVVLAVVSGIALAQEAPRPEPGVIPAPVQVIRPEIEVLDRPVILEVQVEPSLGVDTSMRILCATSSYRGEVQVERQDARVRLSISGEIREIGATKIFASFDVEVQSEDNAGGRSFAAGGGAMLVPGEPKSILTIGGRSVILMVTFAPDESKPRPAGAE